MWLRFFFLKTLLPGGLAGIFLFPDCSRISQQELVAPDPAFGEYIEACTFGVVPADGAIHIRLTSPVTDSTKRAEHLGKKLFGFSPALEGGWTWEDHRTLTFKPARSLAFNQVYTGSFYLGQVKDVPTRFREFRFVFRTLPCYMDVRFQGFETQDGQFSAVMSMRTAEVVSPEVITQCFKVEQGSETIPVRADSGGPGRHHILRTAALDRQNSEPLQWVLKSDENIRATSMDPMTLRLPSAQHFRVAREAFYGLEEGRIQLNFSQPPDPRQDLIHLM